MYRAPPFLVKKDAIAVFSGFDGEASIFFVAESGDERGRIDFKEIGDPLYFIPAEKNPAFAVTAGPAFGAFEGFHEKLPDFQPRNGPFPAELRSPRVSTCDVPYAMYALVKILVWPNSTKKSLISKPEINAAVL